MRRTFQVIFSSFALLLVSTGMVQATCVIVGVPIEHECTICTVENFTGQAFGTGDCRAACKSWGSSGNYNSYWYQSHSSHPPFFPGQATVACNVSDDPNKFSGGLCPVGAGNNECNY